MKGFGAQSITSSGNVRVFAKTRRIVDKNSRMFFRKLWVKE